MKREIAKQLTLRLTASEYAQAKRLSQDSGLKLEPMVRQLIMGMELRPRPPDELSELLRQLSGIGNNINQIARVANAHGYVIGHGGGAMMQHAYCTNLSWEDAQPGDLVFYPEDTHVGIVGGWDEDGNLLIIHCASSANNVVITGSSGFTAIGRPIYYSE